MPWVEVIATTGRQRRQMPNCVANASHFIFFESRWRQRWLPFPSSHNEASSTALWNPVETQVKYVFGEAIAGSLQDSLGLRVVMLKTPCEHLWDVLHHNDIGKPVRTNHRKGFNQVVPRVVAMVFLAMSAKALARRAPDEDERPV